MASIGWGIVGFGWVARDYMAPAIRQAGDRLVATVDPDPAARADAVREGATPYGSLAELAVDARVEAVYVASPNHLHREAVVAMARAGKAVLCEKPMAASVEDAAAMAAACHDAGVLYGTAFDQRHHPGHAALRDAIRAGRIGTVTAARILYACWLGPGWTAGRGAENWRIDAAKAGGGALIDLAPHGVDLVGYLLDEPLVTLQALMQRRVHPYPVDDGAMLMGQTASGILASLHVAYNYPEALPRRRLEIVGTAGLLTATDTMGQDPGGTLAFTDARTGATSALPIPSPDTSPFTAQVRAFGQALRSGERAGFSAERDLRALRLIADAMRAAPQPGFPT